MLDYKNIDIVSTSVDMIIELDMSALGSLWIKLRWNLH